MDFVGSILDFLFGWIPAPDLLPGVPGYVELPLAIVLVIAVIVAAIKVFAQIAGKAILVAAAVAILLFVFTDNPVQAAGKGIGAVRGVASDFVGIVNGDQEPGGAAASPEETDSDAGPRGDPGAAGDNGGNEVAEEPAEESGSEDSDEDTESADKLLDDLIPDIGSATSGEGGQ